MYKIYGDYGYVSETLLEQFNDFGDAVHWCENYCADGDTGGYAMIEIATHAEDGEYVVERRWDAEERFFDDEDQAIFF